MSILRRFALPLVAALAALITACSSPYPPHGVEDLPPQPDHQEVFAASPDGRLLAYGHDSLQLLDERSGATMRLADAAPVALAWRRDGEQLAAGFGNDQERGRLEIFDRNGRSLDERVLPGRILAVAWSSRGDLLVAGYRLRSFSFGANLVQWLVRIHGKDDETITLGDVTIETATIRLFAGKLPSLLGVSFSPSGDELVFFRLHDPPQFPPYLQLLYRNWQVITERKLLDMPVALTTLTWAESGNEIVCRTGNESPRGIELWPLRIDRDPGKEPPQSWHATSPVDHDDRMWSLRKWRFEGLITPDEFAKAAGEVTRP